MSGYAMPEVLVSTEWLAAHQHDPGVVVVEVDVDPSRYDEGHIPGAAGWDWKRQLCDPIQRDILSGAALERLLSEAGITTDHTIVLYGDSHNWFAAWAYWQLAMYGHRDLRLLNGGRLKWEMERRPMNRALPARRPTSYQTQPPNASLRSLLADLRLELAANAVDLVDVRSPDEFSGELLAPPGLSEGCQRGGHIPGAVNVPWSVCVNDHDGTFRSAATLRAIFRAKGIAGDRPVVTYCRIGERSSHTWFVLRYLLGFTPVRNYDGSWTEWGNLVGAPVARGAEGP